MRIKIPKDLEKVTFKSTNYYYCYVSRNYYCTTRLTMLLQSVVFCVSSTSLFKVFVAFDRSSLIPIFLRSCRIVCIHVVFGLPCGLLTFLRYSSKALNLHYHDNPKFKNRVKPTIYLIHFLKRP